jgi:hypothetical protein
MQKQTDCHCEKATTITSCIKAKNLKVNLHHKKDLTPPTQFPTAEIYEN